MTPKELEELIADCPFLYHMAMHDSWESIKRHGLIPTDALLRLFELDADTVADLTQRRRPESFPINHPEHGQATVRDQIPLRHSDLERCLEGGLTPLDWYHRLNERVFFWLTEERLNKLLCAGAYRTSGHLVLKVRTAPIIEKYRDRIELSPMNSGCTRPMAHPRGPETFLPIDQYPYGVWRKKRRRGERVVELTVIGGVPDVVEYVVGASIRSCGGETKVIYEASK